jgi:thymidine kinase
MRLALVLLISFGISCAAPAARAEAPARKEMMTASFLAAHPDVKFRMEGMRAMDDNLPEPAFAAFVEASRYADKASQAMVAVMYWAGTGVPQDRRMAKLYFYYSAMNAGKTTTLLQSAHNYHERGMRTLILTPRLDDRYGEGVVASRIGLKARADLRARRRPARDGPPDIERDGALHCVLVDESQFLSKLQVWQLTEIVDRLTGPGAGLRAAHRFPRRTVRGQPVSAGLGRFLSEIKTICHTGRKATMVVRVDEHGRAITEGRRWRSAATIATCRSRAPSSRRSSPAKAGSNCSSRSCRWNRPTTTAPRFAIRTD